MSAYSFGLKFFLSKPFFILKTLTSCRVVKTWNTLRVCCTESVTTDPRSMSFKHYNTDWPSLLSLLCSSIYSIIFTLHLSYFFGGANMKSASGTKPLATISLNSSSLTSECMLLHYSMRSSSSLESKSASRSEFCLASSFLMQIILYIFA